MQLFDGRHGGMVLRLRGRDPMPDDTPMPDDAPRPVTKEQIRSSGEQAWHLNSTALKSIRDTHEDLAGTPSTDSVDLFDNDPFDIFTVKRSKGTAYELTEPKQPWSWLKFLNALSDDTLQDVVGDGVVGFVCMPILGFLDVKRQTAAKKEGKPYPKNATVPVWDFVVTRTDGGKTRIHPDLTKKRCDIASWEFEYEKLGPKAGKGTYQTMLANTYDKRGTRAKKSAEEDSVANDPGARRESQSGEAGDTSLWTGHWADSKPEGSAEGDQDWWRGHWWDTAASGRHHDANSSYSDAWRERGW